MVWERGSFAGALLVFIISFGIRVPLVDTAYSYSFEPDSPPGVEITRSMYFFMQSPSLQNAPQTLSCNSYYSDGSIISCAIIANIVNPLCRAGIINANLSESDNSLIIFSIRWGSVIFDALAAAIAFLIFTLLARHIIVALLITLLCYLLNIATLGTDFMRIDHYCLFAANLMMLTSLLVYYRPHRKRYFILGGLSTGLVAATKLNFPFYLLIVLAILCYLIYRKYISWRHFLIFILASVLSTAFMYQRWLMYSDNISYLLNFTYNNGKVWTVYWDTTPRAYYLWQEFFDHGSSIPVCFLLIAAYLSFLVVLITGIIRRDPLKVIFCLIFILQSVILIISPKVARYGIIMPLWIGIFLCYGIGFVESLISIRRVEPVYISCLLCMLMLPAFGYWYAGYEMISDKCRTAAYSLNQIRIMPYHWIADHARQGSIFAIQGDRLSSPPIFDLPLVFDDEILNAPFLFKDKLQKFYPPNIDSLPVRINYLLITDKETKLHFFSMDRYGCDSMVYRCWQRFYTSLDTLFPHADFVSTSDCYGVKEVHIYTLNKQPIAIIPIIINGRSTVSQGIQLSWDLTHAIPAKVYSFQVQIAADNLFRRMLYANRDGYPSPYRQPNDPKPELGQNKSVVPRPIFDAMMRGDFHDIIGNQNPRDIQGEIQELFRQVLIYMLEQDISFGQSLKLVSKEEWGNKFILAINTVYGGRCPFMDSHIDDFIRAAKLDVSLEDLRNKGTATMNYSFRPMMNFELGKKYYWRVRLRYKYETMSDWSPIYTLSP
jgi:hypothetical protein